MLGTDLRTLLNAAAPRERSGSQTVGRYGFQANIGILKLLELRETGNDFRLVFDFFDDLAVLNSSTAPTEIRLYQVKSKDPGDWTASDLCKLTGKKAPRSIVARLYSHLDMFGPAVAETAVISNAPYKVQLQSGAHSSGTHHRIEGQDLHSEEIDKITKAVTADINPSNVPAWLPKFALIRTTLGVHGQDVVITGSLLKHFEKVGSADGVQITAVYETLHASIEHKTAFSEEGLSQTEIITRKSLSKGEFDELLTRAAARRRGVLADWEIIRTDLDKASIGSRRIIQLKTYAVRYLQARQSAQPQATRLKTFLAGWITANRKGVDDCETIGSLAALLGSALPDKFGYGDVELQAALIVEAYEVTNEET